MIPFVQDHKVEYGRRYEVSPQFAITVTHEVCPAVTLAAARGGVLEVGGG